MELVTPKLFAFLWICIYCTLNLYFVLCNMCKSIYKRVNYTIKQNSIFHLLN